jgi:hypothetical protein
LEQGAALLFIIVVAAAMVAGLVEVALFSISSLKFFEHKK